jgi:adenine-specific DNA methylase
MVIDQLAILECEKTTALESLFHAAAAALLPGTRSIRPLSKLARACHENQKSSFCNEKTALQELGKIAEEANCKTLILSYNTEGIMPQKKIISALEKYGEVELVEFDYLRFKSNNNGDSKHKKFIKEQLYILKKI